MKPRTCIIQFEIVTDLPVKVLREYWLVGYSKVNCSGLRYIYPVNKPRIEVVQPAKKAKGRVVQGSKDPIFKPWTGANVTTGTRAMTLADVKYLSPKPCPRPKRTKPRGKR